jgi:hypothetical protein
MTKEEIKAKIQATIAGQGSAVDIGGQLPTILDAIIDLIPEGGEIPIATAETLGGVKVGEGLNITEEGLLSAQGGSVQNAGIILNLGAEIEFDTIYAEEEFDARYGEGMAQALIDGVTNGNIVAIRDTTDIYYADNNRDTFGYHYDAGSGGYISAFSINLDAGIYFESL